MMLHWDRYFKINTLLQRTKNTLRYSRKVCSSSYLEKKYHIPRYFIGFEITIEIIFFTKSEEWRLVKVRDAAIFQAKSKASDSQAVAHIFHISIHHYLCSNTVSAFFKAFPRKKRNHPWCNKRRSFESQVYDKFHCYCVWSCGVVIDLGNYCETKNMLSNLLIAIIRVLWSSLVVDFLNKVRKNHLDSCQLSYIWKEKKKQP